MSPQLKQHIVVIENIKISIKNYHNFLIYLSYFILFYTSEYHKCKLMRYTVTWYIIECKCKKILALEDYF